MKVSRETVALLAALIGLIAAIISLVTSIVNARKTEENTTQIQRTSEEIEMIKNCRGQVATRILSPDQSALEQVGELVSVTGEATVNETCHYVVLIMHDSSAPGRPWSISDLVQINTTGEWNGNVKLDTVQIGSTVEIDARIVSDPTKFVVGQSLPTPPDQGVRSNIVRVRRVK